MSRHKYLFVAGMLALILVVSMGLTACYVRFSGQEKSERELTVVTSFYPVYIAAMNVTADAKHVKLSSLSEPQTGCLHDFQLTPEDMKLLSTADVFIINGGGIESFMQKVAAAYPKLTIVNACEYTELLSDGEEENAHAWLSIPCYREMVAAIAGGLKEADGANAALYEKNAADYDKKLEQLQQKQQEVREKTKGKDVVLFHEAYAYVAADYGMNVRFVLDLDEERQVSAGEMSGVLSAVADGAKVILAEERYGKKVAETIRTETDVTVVYLDPLNRGEYDKDSYLKGMERNLKLILGQIT